MYFPVAGIDVNPLIPPAVAFGISFFTSMSGVSGAFMLLPFQMSVLGFTSPSVSATNQLFNIVAIPGGVYRYIREGRMVWPLTWVVIAGTLPGVLVGAVIRVKYLPDPAKFKLFAAFVLAYIGFRLVRDIMEGKKESTGKPSAEERFQKLVKEFSRANKTGELPRIRVRHFTLTSISYALMGTFVTSVAGVAFYQALAPFYPDMAVAPDWLLGFLFGIGGTLGMYCGARVQKRMPARAIKIILAACIFFVACKYAWAFLGG